MDCDDLVEEGEEEEGTVREGRFIIIRCAKARVGARAPDHF